VNEAMLESISAIGNQLDLRSQEDREGINGAMLRLYRQSILTIANLEVIVRMADADIRSGSVTSRSF
jgi:hypothetical protein